jgi:hypothetical protein
MKQLCLILLFISLQGLSIHAGAQSSTSASATDIGWPRQFSADAGTVVLYQPQVDDWKDYKTLDGRAAFSFTPKGGNQIVGIVEIEAGTDVNKDNRTVYLHDLKVTDLRFPSLNADSSKWADAQVRKILPTDAQPLSLDRLMADVDQKKNPTNAAPINVDPPGIFYSAAPAILLMVIGDPVLNPIEKTDLTYVVNTNWDLFQYKKDKKYFLLANKTWYSATDLKGPWAQTGKLPKDMTKLPSGQNFDDVKKMLPPPPVSGTAPKIFFSDKPAELILIKGSPVYGRITGTNLLYVTNTDNDLFLDNAGKQFYVLLSGRWFRSGDLNGPWTYAGNDLPADFAKIPEKSPKGKILASVPGTEDAEDAVMLAQIPTTATVNKAAAEANVKVTYDGTPQFKPIEKTDLQYATNTQDKVIMDGAQYYCCYQAVWFVSSSPTGPWKTAESVPKEIYSIPPSSPVYNVTYVTQVNTSSTTVESSTTAGYFGMFILGAAIGATIAYGTGFFYPPYMYMGPGMLCPIYRPWPATYGVGAVYNPWTGGYAVGRSAYGPYGAAHSAAWYNPATGRYGRSGSVQGPYGGRSAGSVYNPWTGGAAHTNQGHNPYAQWGSSVATRNGQAIQTGHITTRNGTTAGYRTSTGQSGVVHTGPNGGAVVRGPNGTYAGKDGNVYRKDANGGWQQKTGNNWNRANPPSNVTQAAQNRQRGQAQTQRFQRSGGGGRLGGGGGGVRRSGGGFRGRR